jgi:hypothetical protein
MDAQPFFRDLSGGRSPELGISQHDRIEACEIAAREEMARDRAMFGTPRRAQPELEVKAPTLPEDFKAQVVALDEKIFSRGIAIDRERLLSLGRERFEQLLAADRKAPRGRIGAGVDVSQWQSVQSALSAYECASVPRRTTNEQVSGSGKDREATRQIAGFVDLWKATHERQEVLRDIYGFRDMFESLCFGQSILDRLSKDGRVRSRFFCGGKGRRLELLRDWEQVLQSTLTRVTLIQPLWHLLVFLADEKATTPSVIDLAKEFYGVRSPSKEQIKIVQSVFDGFLLGHREWPLFEYVGRQTRSMIDEPRLSSWRKELATRFIRVAAWHEEVRAFFVRDVQSGDVRYAHREPDTKTHRAFLDSMITELRDATGALLALGLQDVSKHTVIARFQDRVLVESKHKLEDKRTQIARQLAIAFPRSTFELQFEKVHS